MQGILFKPEMIKAIQDGRKTQTRRIIKSKHESGLFRVSMTKTGQVTEITSLDWYEWPKNGCTGDIQPKYKVGEVIYVKEGWYLSDKWTGDVVYKTDGDTHDFEDGIGVFPIKWKNAMFMPASAARIFLEITNVRVEKLGEISDSDIRQEGLSFPDYDLKWQWRALWQKINKTYAPEMYVFVYEFKKVERP